MKTPKELIEDAYLIGILEAYKEMREACLIEIEKLRLHFNHKDKKLYGKKFIVDELERLKERIR